MFLNPHPEILRRPLAEGLLQNDTTTVVALAVEAGIEVENIPESGLVDFQQLVSFWRL